LLAFLAAADLDWAGFFPFSPEEATYAAGLPDQVPSVLARERLAECSELQDTITARRRQDLVGRTLRVLVDEPGAGRSHMEAPDIDGMIRLGGSVQTGSWVDVVVTGAEGPDLDGEVLAAAVS
jgi:ribosomal protein S12 methylthiotransferase